MIQRDLILYVSASVCPHPDRLSYLTSPDTDLSFPEHCLKCI